MHISLRRSMYRQNLSPQIDASLSVDNHSLSVAGCSMTMNGTNLERRELQTSLQQLKYNYSHWKLLGFSSIADISCGSGFG